MLKTPVSVFIMIVLFMGITSCVTQKKYMELDAVQKKCEEENSFLKKTNIELTTQNNELRAQNTNLQEKNRKLVSDSLTAGMNFRNLTEKYDRLNKSYEDLNQLLQQNTTASSAEMRKLMDELQKAQSALMVQEDALRKAEKELTLKQNDLAEKEKRLIELQSILSKKDSAVSALKNKVLDALVGFVGNGLTVEQKNGKIYVRMDEKLLFATGSFEVAPNGANALKNLAKVLESNPDINITVEGHTDHVPYKAGSSPINDNWDLSVMRATAVVKILVRNSKIDPARLTASGRSQYIPVDPADTPEAKARNRRTEIILTPKLDELLKVLETN